MSQYISVSSSLTTSSAAVHTHCGDNNHIAFQEMVFNEILLLQTKKQTATE